MALLDKLTTAAGKAVDKGSDVIEVTKLKAKISSAEKDIVSLKCDIADFYLKQREAGETIDAGIAPVMAQIDDKLEEIKALNDQIQDIKA